MNIMNQENKDVILSYRKSEIDSLREKIEALELLTLHYRSVFLKYARHVGKCNKTSQNLPFSAGCRCGLNNILHNMQQENLLK